MPGSSGCRGVSIQFEPIAGTDIDADRCVRRPIWLLSGPRRVVHMSSLHPRAQAIVERFATRDFSQRRLEKQVVEHAIGQHLEALEVPQRPVRWFADAMSAIAHMTLRLDPITGELSDALARLKVQLSPLHVDSEPG